MTPAPPGSEPGGFELGPELWLLGLGVFATAVILGVFIWLIRNTIKEDREAPACDALENSRSVREPGEEDNK